MKFLKTDITGVAIIEPTVFSDNRGYFLESFNKKNFEDNISKINFVQDNESKSSRGVLRGLHFQQGEYAQSKLVGVLQGTILDVVVDIRQASPTFGEQVSVELSAENNQQLWIPKGFAHGFSVLSETALVCYKCDAYYNKETESGIHPLDKTLNIDWQIPTDKQRISEKDLLLPTFNTLNK